MKAALSNILFMWEKLARAVPLAVVKAAHKQMPRAGEEVSSCSQMCSEYHLIEILVGPFTLVGTVQPA